VPRGTIARGRCSRRVVSFERTPGFFGGWGGLHKSSLRAFACKWSVNPCIVPRGTICRSRGSECSPVAHSSAWGEELLHCATWHNWSRGRHPSVRLWLTARRGGKSLHCATWHNMHCSQLSALSYPLSTPEHEQADRFRSFFQSHLIDRDFPAAGFDPFGE